MKEFFQTIADYPYIAMAIVGAIIMVINEIGEAIRKSKK